MRTPGEIDELLAPLFPGLMGMRVTAVGAERVVGTLEVRADLGTAGGTLHGGAVMAFAPGSWRSSRKRNSCSTPRMKRPPRSLRSLSPAGAGQWPWAARRH
jgi:hypothetical protein